MLSAATVIFDKRCASSENFAHSTKKTSYLLPAVKRQRDGPAAASGRKGYLLPETASYLSTS